MVSSLDEGHPGDNIIDGREDTYWISTGLYPQEILLAMSERSMVSTVKIVTSNVRGLRIESCAEDDPVNFKTLAEDELEELSGRLQVKEIPCQGVEPAAYIKVMVLSGYHDFCTVHRVIVE
ncbi:IFT25 [Symbiodinium pilosum]|uniref:IFT25 protein n=1 Tax=Symbiodinium pilosum TaxID=2952 RepID=A0A812X3V0_SYMPI|nr:IFT25 [Symbiodinium pilosum]